MKKIKYFVVLLFLILACLFCFLAGKNSLQPSVVTQSSGTAHMVALINDERIKANVPPLKENTKLNKSAQKKCEDILNKDYWAHVSPTGTTPWSFFRAVGYDYYYAGENLAMYDNDYVAMDALMKSQSHKDNILSRNFKEVGIGKCGNSTVQYIVQHFGALK